MGQTMDQMKMINQLRKAQKDLKNEIVEVEAGDGAVVVQINGELNFHGGTHCFLHGIQNQGENLRKRSIVVFQNVGKIDNTWSVT